MPGPALPPQPGREDCPHKQILIDDIKAVISEILKLHTNEFEAMLNGDFSMAPDTQERLRMAREHKAQLMERYREHVTSHGC